MSASIHVYTPQMCTHHSRHGFAASRDGLLSGHGQGRAGAHLHEQGAQIRPPAGFSHFFPGFPLKMVDFQTFCYQTFTRVVLRALQSDPLLGRLFLGDGGKDNLADAAALTAPCFAG